MAVTDPEKRKVLAEIANGQKHIIECPIFLVFIADLSRNERLGKAEGKTLEVMPYLDAFLVASIDAAMAAQNAVIAAESLGLPYLSGPYLAPVLFAGAASILLFVWLRPDPYALAYERTSVDGVGAGQPEYQERPVRIAEPKEVQPLFLEPEAPIRVHTSGPAQGEVESRGGFGQQALLVVCLHIPFGPSTDRIVAGQQ